MDLREAFEKLVAAGKLGRQHVEALLELTSSGFCSHRNWGFGRITSVDTVFARFTIDFPNRPGHAMDLGFAAESLKPIPRDHILARKSSDLEGLRQLAAMNHLELIKLVLKSYQGRATLDQIQHILVPDVIPQDWRKWWENAKHELKKDGHFVVPTKKTEPITYQQTEVPLDQRLLSEFNNSKGLKAKVAVAIEVQKNLEDVDDKAVLVGPILAALNADIHTHQRTQPAVALEAIFVRDDLAATIGAPPDPTALSASSVWTPETRLAEVLAAAPVAKHRRILESFKAAHAGDWDEAVLATLNDTPSKVCGECAHLLIHEGKLDALKQRLAIWISQHKASSELLLWLAKERSDSYADILGPEVFRAMMTAMERDEFNEKRSNRLRDFIVDDQELLVELIGVADLDVIKDLTRALQLSTVFDDMDKRSLLARIVKSYPAVQSLISGEQNKPDDSLIVSGKSLERRRGEYNELVHQKIPANSKEIAIARSYGDLRENHEYKAAKEMQKLLMRRKVELELQLLQARVTDFTNPRTDVVSLGTRVRLTDLDTQHPETYCILGAWDTDPDRGLISYLTPMGRSLLNRLVGDTVEYESDGHRKRYRIDAIEAYVPTELAAPLPDAGSAPLASPPTVIPAMPPAHAAPQPPEPQPAPASAPEPGPLSVPASGSSSETVSIASAQRPP
ncbi:MAG: GreA/GreB family elongation factor [Verrucomicrobia bacterium]|nr:GreA/GreB family elongation factor [Verrucomicrobiota bacterium]